MQSSSERWTACTLLLFAHSLPYCTGCCTGTTCQNICALSKYPRFREFSPIFRGRLLSSNQRAVKEKVVHFGLLFQMSPLGTSWAWPSRSCAERGGAGAYKQRNRWHHEPCVACGEGGRGRGVGRAKDCLGRCVTALIGCKQATSAGLFPTFNSPSISLSLHSGWL